MTEHHPQEQVGNSDQNSVFLPRRGTYYRVYFQDIIYVSSEGHYCTFNLADQESFTVRMRMGQVEELLPDEDFLRVHRRYLIQLSYLDSVNPREGILDMQGEQLPLSRSYRSTLEERLRFL